MLKSPGTRDTKRPYLAKTPVLLVALTLQTSLHALLMRYLRTRPGPTYIASSAVFVTEVAKTCIAFLMAGAPIKSKVHSKALHAASLFGTFSLYICNNAHLIACMAVPSALYAVQSNLLILAIRHLDACTFQATLQLKILITALFSVVFLKKPLTAKQGVGIALLFVGVVAVLAAQQDQEEAMPSIKRGGNKVTGLIVVTACCVISAFAGVFMEKATNKLRSTMSIWERSQLLSVSCCIFSFILMVYNDGGLLLKNGLFFGYNWLTAVAIGLQVIGGFLIAMVVEECGNLMKVISNSSAFVVSAAITFAVTKSLPSAWFLVGCVLVFSGGFLFFH